MLLYSIFPTVLITSVVCIKYDVEQIKNYINQGLDCLDQYKVLGQNATFHLMTGYGNTDISAVVPNLNQCILGDIKNIQIRVNKILQKSYDAYPNDPVRILYNSMYFYQLTNVTFVEGQLEQLPPLKNMTINDILTQNMPSDFVQNCYAKIIMDNPPCNGLRKCKLPCKKQMKNKKSDNLKISPTGKLYYYTYAMVMNCSNYSPIEYRNIATYYCSYVYTELERILEFEGKHGFETAYAYFLDMAGFCAAFGNPDFLNQNIMKAVINQIDCNGCVGVKTKNVDTIQVLTADTVAYLIVSLRYGIESALEEYTVQ